MSPYKSLLQDTASFNHNLNLTRRILKSRNKAKLAMLPSIFRKPGQSNPSPQVLIESVVSEESQASCSPKPSNSRGSVTVNSNPKRKIFHQARRSMRHHIRSHNTLSSPVGAAGIKEDQGNIHLPENPFSPVIQAAEQLIPTLSAMNLAPVHSHSVTINNTAPTVTTSRSNTRIPFSGLIRASEHLLVDRASMGLVDHVIQEAEQLLANLAAKGLAPARPSRVDHVIQEAEQVLAALASKGLAPTRPPSTPQAM